MISRITPNYYAKGGYVDECTLEGVNIDVIPRDAVGIIASENDNPVRLRYTQLGQLIFDIAEQSSTRVRLVPRVVTTHDIDMYLGMIVSADRSVIYWVNDTKPLP